jgi:hypothetical protein
LLNSDVLEVATGLVFIYLLLSLITTSLREGLEGFLKDRGKALETGLGELLGDRDGAAGWLQAFYNQPLINALFRGVYQPPNGEAKARKQAAQKLPSYIPASSFALAVLDIVTDDGPSAIPLTIERLASAVDRLPDGQLKDALRLAVQTSQNDINKVQAFLEDWFNAAMDRVSGLYKRNTQAIVFAFSLVACIGLNVNTVTITTALSQNLSLRSAITAQADAAATNPDFVNAMSNSTALDAQIGEIQQYQGLPIGWGDTACAQLAQLTPNACFWRTPDAKAPPAKPASLVGTVLGVLEIIAGWAMTAFAITLGAPFWFDVLNKIMVVRSTVKPDEKSGEEASKDPTAGAATPTPTLTVQAAGPGDAAQAAAPPPVVAAAAAPPPPTNPDDQDEVMAIDPYGRPRENT